MLVGDADSECMDQRACLGSAVVYFECVLYASIPGWVVADGRGLVYAHTYALCVAAHHGVITSCARPHEASLHHMLYVSVQVQRESF